MKRLIKIITFLFIFSISIINVSAKSATCEYQYFRLKIDDSGNITSETINNNPIPRNIKQTIINSSDFINDSNQYYCKDKIYYLALGIDKNGKITQNSQEAVSINFYLSFKPNTAINDVGTISESNYELTSSSIDNSTNNPGNTPTIKKRCVYDQYSVLVYSDNTVKAERDNRYREIRLDETAKKHFTSLNCCPYKIFVSDSVAAGTGDTATITTGPNSNNTDYSYIAGETNRCDPEATLNSEPTKITTKTTKKIDITGQSGCTNILGTDVTRILHNILRTIQYAGPILVAVMTIIDLIKASLSGEQDELKKVYSKFIKRLVAAILLFFIPLIINLLFDIVGIGNDKICI